MSTASDVGWHAQAACVDTDRGLFFRPNGAAAQAICCGCPVRAECLYDALAHDAPIGIWGGLTRKERRALPLLPADRSAALDVLRELLPTAAATAPVPTATTKTPRTLRRARPKEEPVTVDALKNLLSEIDEQGGPEAARHNRLRLPDEGIPMPTAPAPSPAPPAADVPLKTAARVSLKPLAQASVGSLLAWGDEHPDPDVQDQAARVRASLAGLQQRHAADEELTAITTEAADLEKRLAELRSREAELAPAKKAKRKPGSYVRDYDTRTVRDWAAANGVECPSFGQIPKRVLDAWRKTDGTQDGRP
ncbi:WhiB family transcriptional regulator [Streptomyces sp. NPDC000888]